MNKMLCVEYIIYKSKCWSQHYNGNIFSTTECEQFVKKNGFQSLCSLLVFDWKALGKVSSIIQLINICIFENEKELGQQFEKSNGSKMLEMGWKFIENYFWDKNWTPK